MKTWTLHDKTLELARAFEAEAGTMDAVFVSKADPRAIQGGAIDEEAERLRAIARELRLIAAKVE